MKQFLLIAIIVIFSASTGSGRNAESLVIQNANVIDVASGKMQLLNLKIEDGIIQKISSKPLKGAKKIDLKGKYIIPHLWDMHVHTHEDLSKLENLAKAGILGVRDMGVFGQDEINFLQKQISSEATSKNLIPNIFYAGFIHNGKACEVKEHRSVDTISELKESIAFQKKNNLTFFKIHNCFPASLIPDLRELSKKEKLKITGHIPQGIDPIEYAQLGVSSIEHIDIIMRALLFRKKDPAKSIEEAVKILETDYLDRLAMALVENKVALTPTLVTYENFVKSLPEKQKPLGKALFKKLQNFTKRFSEKGVLMLAGTDLGLPGIEPGESLIRELKLMVDSGMTPLEALQTATVNPVKYLHLPKSSIAEKSKANLIILDKNPLEKIENLEGITAVIKNGKYKITAE